jgi:hypothetical protein
VRVSVKFVFTVGAGLINGVKEVVAFGMNTEGLSLVQINPPE